MKKTIKAMLLVIMLAGCSIPGMGDSEKTTPVTQEKKYTVAELTEGGVIDVEKAKSAGYVPYAEAANDIVISRNDEAKKYVDAHYDDIVTNAKIAIKEMIGRDVEITFIGTPFPYMAAEISYKTADFPVIFGSTGVSLADSLQFLDGGYKEIDELTVKRLTVEALYAYAFEEEINVMASYFREQFPEYFPVEIGTEHSNILRKKTPFITIEAGLPNGESLNRYKTDIIDSIYFIYNENKEMNQEELRELFKKQEEFYIVVRYNGYLKDEAVIPTKEMYKKIMEEIRNYNYSWCNNKLNGNPVTIGSNLREKGDFYSMVELSEII